VTRPLVIVPTFNGAERLPLLLESLRSQTVDHDVVVVVNASTDRTHELVRTRFPQVRVVVLDENVGFGAAVNRAATDAKSPVLVLVNDDAVCEAEFVERLAATIDPPRGIVMAAGVLLRDGDAGRIDSAGIVFDRTLFGLDHLTGQPLSALRGAAEPLGPTGGAAAFDRRSFLRVGGFDERFFAYLEDVDLVARLIAAGGRCRLASEARAVHRHSATLGSGSREKNRLMGWSRGYTIGKYRVHRRPGLIARALLIETTIALGQLLIDGTGSGIGGRAAGFRAGRRAPAHQPPALPPEAPSFGVLYALRTRLARRWPPARP
jgi:GT2 family glycosyltransferase